MANLNERNQQILGILSLAGGAARGLATTFGETDRGKSSQKEFKDRSEQTRVSIRKYGVEKPSLTYIGMTPPPIFDTVVPDATALMNTLVTLRAERVNQPGVQIMTSNVRRYGVGPTEKKPFSAAFGDLNISFVGDASGIIHQFFYTWLSGVVGFYDMPDGGDSMDIFEKRPFEVEYRDNYKTIIDIVMFDEVQEKIGVVKLYNAYPIGLGEVQRDWSGINDLVRVPVTFTFSHWSYNSDILGLKEPSRESLASKNMSLFDNVIRGMTALQAISAIKRPQNVNDIISVVNTGSTLLQSFLPSRRIDY